MTIPLTVKQLEMLVKISEGQSLSEAARLLNLSPSAVSKGLAGMEESLGVSLIQRTTRNFRLTEAGEYFVARAGDLLKDFDELINTTSGYFNHPRGALKVTCSVAFGYSHLIDIYENYKRKNPQVELVIDLNDNIVNLNENDIDIALRITSSPPQNYAMRQLARISWIYCATPEYLARMGTPMSVRELYRHECLVYPGITPTCRDKSPMTEGDVQTLTPIKANSSLILLKAVLAHQGIAYLPSYLVAQYLDSQQLLPLRLDGKLTCTSHSLYALYFPSRYRNPKVRSFIDFLVEDVQPWNDWEKWIDDEC
ncbi:LysR family transcriptional regulator [Klebsiella spallanzanii]|nr:LysR family transcriptional regulator [Klebsiella spallanzanii]